MFPRERWRADFPKVLHICICVTGKINFTEGAHATQGQVAAVSNSFFNLSGTLTYAPGGLVMCKEETQTSESFTTDLPSCTTSSPKHLQTQHQAERHRFLSSVTRMLGFGGCHVTDFEIFFVMNLETQYIIRKVSSSFSSRYDTISTQTLFDKWPISQQIKYHVWKI